MTTTADIDQVAVKPIRTNKGVYQPGYQRYIHRPKQEKADDPRSVVHTKRTTFKNIRNGKPTDYAKILRRPHTPIPFNGPIYDWDTKNESFLQVQQQLESLGVKNNAFHLLLFNPLLKGIDPYDENLTGEQVLMVIHECQINIFYYIREVVRIPEQGSGIPVRFRMDRGTLAALFCFANDINFYLIKPRQTGKSVGIAAMLSWAFKFGVTNGQFMFAGNQEKTPKENLKKMKLYINMLPSYLAKMGTQTKDSSGRTVRKINNVKSYLEPVTNNSAMCAGCAISESAAEEIGRGDSHVYEFFDEAEFTSWIETIVQVSGMAFNTASQNALKNNAHACRIFASTPGDLSDKKKCGSAMKIVDDAMVWEETIYDKDINEVKAELYKKSKYHVIYIEYSYKQLGYGEEWFRWACSQVGGNVAKIRREILLQRFSGNNMSPFSDQDIIELEENQKKPVFVKTVGKIYDLRFYQKPEDIKKGRLHFISIDPSDGTGSDNYAIVVVDPYTLETIMEFKSPYMSPTDCKKLVEYMVRMYFPKPMIIVESNRNGIAVSDKLKEGWLRPFMYASPEADSSIELGRDVLDEKGFIKEQLMRRKYFGIKTLGTSRSIMMGLLTDAVRFRKDILTAEYVVDDINHLVLKDGKIQAAPGEHDDVIMAWVICMYTIYYGKKLERYGFHKGHLPDDIEMDDEFVKLQKLYQNPIIRQQFPTMYEFWKNHQEEQMRKEHALRVKEEMDSQKISMDIGAIQTDDMPDDMDFIAGQTSNEEAWKTSLRNRWFSLNK